MYGMNHIAVPSWIPLVPRTVSKVPESNYQNWVEQKEIIWLNLHLYTWGPFNNIVIDLVYTLANAWSDQHVS